MCLAVVGFMMLALLEITRQEPVRYLPPLEAKENKSMMYWWSWPWVWWWVLWVPPSRTEDAGRTAHEEESLVSELYRELEDHGVEGLISWPL